MTIISNTLKLALFQTDLIWEDRQANLSNISMALQNMKEPCDVIILPEAFSTGFSMDAPKVAETMSGKAVEWMKSIAKQYNSALCGSLFIEDKGYYYNRFIWANPTGELFFYDKRHLFSVGEELRNYTRGKERVVIQYKGWKIFPTVCYDLRFPVWSRNTSGYDLLINVANWPAARRKVWKTLLKARAIENQCYVAGVNRLGVDGNNIAYSGDSTVINPKGVPTAKGLNKNQILFSEIDLEALKSFRAKFDTLSDADQFKLLL